MVRAVLVDATETLAAVMERLARPGDPRVAIHRDPAVAPDALPAVLDGAQIAVVDHAHLPTPVALRCRGLRHVVFLGTGARCYMDPEAPGRAGISVHLVEGYGDTAVAERAVGLMWAAAKGFARMDGAMREGRWLRTEGIQLTGRTLGLLGFGGIAAEVARLAAGSGLRVSAWNRTPGERPGVAFVPLDRLLADSDVLSLHLLLTEETRSFLSRERIAAMRPGAILIDTARGALADEDAVVDALRSGRLGHAGLDVYATEPLPPAHPLTALPNVTLSAHSAFRTPEASDNLIRAALDHCRRIAAGDAAGAAG